MSPFLENAVTVALGGATGRSGTASEARVLVDGLDRFVVGGVGEKGLGLGWGVKSSPDRR